MLPAAFGEVISTEVYILCPDWALSYYSVCTIKKRKAPLFLSHFFWSMRFVALVKFTTRLINEQYNNAKNSKLFLGTAYITTSDITSAGCLTLTLKTLF